MRSPARSHERLPDPDKRFNAGLGGNACRAADLFEGNKINLIGESLRRRYPGGLVSGQQACGERYYRDNPG